MVARQAGDQLSAAWVRRRLCSPIVPCIHEYSGKSSVFFEPEIIIVVLVSLLRARTGTRSPLPAAIKEIAKEEGRIWEQSLLKGSVCPPQIFVCIQNGQA